VSIDDFFLGHADNRITRRYVFTDRSTEQRALLERISSITQSPTDIPRLLDYRHQVVNLNVVYGEGGIGKSALIKHVGSSFSANPADSHRAVTYIDFGDFTNHNFEVVLIKIRSALAHLARDWPAFDLAFASYWSRKHPGTNLLRFLDHAGFLSEDERHLIIDQLTSILDAVLGGTGFISAGYRLTALLKQHILQSRRTRHLRDEYPPFSIIVDEPEPDRALGYLPTLLAYDLEQARRRERLQVLCLLDTLEYVQLAKQDKGSIEDLISRLVYLMPNVAFLAASRVSLKWHDLAHSSTLTYGGPDRWPNLAGSAHGQFEIVGLDPSSSDELLRESLQIDGATAMPETVRQRIIRGSHGLPLHLELSVNWYRELIQQGRRPEPDQVAESFPDLVFRIMRDLSGDERDLLRASSLLEAFSEQLLTALLPSVRGTHLSRFLERSFIQRSPASWLPYALHDNLRRAVIEYDHLTDDAWTTTEWHLRAGQAVTWIEKQALLVWDSDSSSPTESEAAGRRIVSALLLVANAAVEHGILPTSLGDLAFAASEFGYRRVYSSLPASEDAQTELRRLFVVAHALANTELSPNDVYNKILPHVNFSKSDGYDQFISAEFANVAEVVGHFSEAERAYSSLTNASPEIAYYGRLGLAGNYLRAGKLATALAAVPHPTGHPLRRAATYDLLGHVHLQGGEHRKAADFFQHGHDAAIESGSPVWLARALRHLAMAKMWYDADATLAILPDARDYNEALGERIGLAQCELSEALAWAWKGELARAQDLLNTCENYDLDMQAIGQPWMVQALLSKASGDDRAAGSAAEAAYATTYTDASRPTVWLALTCLWADRPDLADFNAIDWYDTADSTRTRWLEPLERMRRVITANLQP
jgi:tetratricopeptide (TPR) repeat protein